MLFNVLSMPVDKRRNPALFYAQHKLDEANYLLFALAMRRVASLDNVRNPLSRQDIPSVLYHDADHFQLTSMAAQLFAAQNGAEPVIPFRNYEDYRTFHADVPYDFITLAMSPRYAPKEADALREVIAPYIAEE